jgi:hypothetical protein
LSFHNAFHDNVAEIVAAAGLQAVCDWDQVSKPARSCNKLAVSIGGAPTVGFEELRDKLRIELNVFRAALAMVWVGPDLLLVDVCLSITLSTIM